MVGGGFAKCSYHCRDVRFELTSHRGPIALRRVNSGGCPASRTCLVAADVFTMNWHDYFTYDQETGTLWWKERPREHFDTYQCFRRWNANFSNIEAGYRASRYGKPSSMVVCFNYKPTLIHRIIWEMVHGDIPANMTIDHINGDPWDNRLINLRLATGRQNRWNSAKPKNNTSGSVGVFWRPERNRWMARMMSGYPKRTTWCRSFKTIEEATEAYNKRAMEVRGEFARQPTIYG